MTDAEIVDEVLVPARGAYIPVPDLRVIERPSWSQIITPSITRGGNNEVAHAELADDEADAVIDRVIEEYRAAGVRWRWTIGPGSRPADLADRLVARGFLRHEVAGMARSTAGITPVDGVTIERADARTVDEYSDVMAHGWGNDPAPLRAANAHALGARGHHLYLARVDGLAVGASKAIWFPKSSFLQGGVVLASHRSRGAYRAMVAARLADAAAAGIELATTHARPETSGPILERLGFRVVVRFASYFAPRSL